MTNTPRPPERTIKDELFSHFARVGKALSSHKRLEIIEVLAQAERSVEELAVLAGVSVANASAHLKVLFQARLVERRKDGQRVFYRLASPRVVRVFRELEALGREQLAEVEQLVARYYERPDEFEPMTSVELERRLADGDVVVLDVRPAVEYAAGHLPGAINIPVAELERRLSELPADREYVAYCRGPFCLMSVDAAALLTKHGRRARRLRDGVREWEAAGRPIETASHL